MFCDVLIRLSLPHPQLSLMRSLRTSVVEGNFPEFVRGFMSRMHPGGHYDEWAVNALASVNISLQPSGEGGEEEAAGQ